MVHILLLLLKAIGLIILTILGIFLLLVLLLIFTPLRYEISGDCGGTLDMLNINAKFSFFIRLITINIQYHKENLSWQIRLAWKKLTSEEPEEAKEITSSASKPLHEKSQKTSEISTIKKTVSDKKESNSTKENIKDKTIQKNQNEKSPEKTDKILLSSEKEDSVPEKEEKSGLADKISNLIKKFKCTVTKICDIINTIKEKSNEIIEFLNHEHHKTAFTKFITEIKRLFKKLKPKKLNGMITFGFEDPALTGKVLGGISILYPYIQNNLTINADFDEAKLLGNLYIKGRIRISMFLSFLLHLLFNKSIRITIGDALKFVKKLKQGGN